MIIVYLLLLSFLNSIIGCCILASIDDEQESLLAWARQCPLGIGAVISCWPIVCVACCLCGRDSSRPDL
jgi:hypothetical protein